MKIHEYQAKQILARYGLRIPRGEVAYTKEEARQIADRIGGTVVVKAQIHAGGRGKGGGIKLAKNPYEAAEIAGRMLGTNLVTAQTGPEGRQVQKVLVEEGLDIRRELYLGIVIDRQTGKPVFMASGSGGMEIEEVAARNPDAILKEYIRPGADRRRRRIHDVALPRVRGHRRIARGNQSIPDHRRQQSVCARRENELR